MSGRLLTYPFSAVVGETTAKRALMCLLADDAINGVLIKGPSGTAKSVLVRSVVNLTDRKVVDLPAGSGDEDIFGGIDFENAVKTGKASLRGGILSRADGNVLCIDNINLSSPKTMDTVLECISSGTVKIEREGVSAEYPVRTSVVATMDPLERDIPMAVADRFDICVSMDVEEDPHVRGEVTERCLKFSEDRRGLCARFTGCDAEIRKKIERARSLIPKIRITRRDIHDIVIICSKMNAVGHRGDIACAKVARALCALDGRDHLSEDDIRDASIMCLLHRRSPRTIEKSRDIDNVDDQVEETITGAELRKLEKMTEESMRIEKEYFEQAAKEPESTAAPEEEEEETAEEESPPDAWDDDDDMKIDVEVLTYVLDEVRNELDEIDRVEDIRLSSIVGKMPRDSTSKDGRGRVGGFRIPAGKTADPALGATVRCAAPYQKSRVSNGLKITIRPEDIRENVRKKQSTCSFLFALDVSGSLVNTGALEEAVMGVRAMLEDSYTRRDRVGLLTFGQRKVNLAVPFTRNVESVVEAIRRTPTGGSTPIGEAFLAIQKYLTNYLRKNPEESCYVIMITDTEPDHPIIDGSEPWGELKRVVATLKIPNTQWVIIDNGLRSRRVNHSRIVAGMLGGKYIELDDLVGRFADGRS